MLNSLKKDDGPVRMVTFGYLRKDIEYQGKTKFYCASIEIAEAAGLLPGTEVTERQFVYRLNRILMLISAGHSLASAQYVLHCELDNS